MVFVLKQDPVYICINLSFAGKVVIETKYHYSHQISLLIPSMLRETILILRDKYLQEVTTCDRQGTDFSNCHLMQGRCINLDQKESDTRK